MTDIIKKNNIPFERKLHRYLNFNTYYFDRQEFDTLIYNYFKDEKTNPFRYFLYQFERNYNPQDEFEIHIQGCFILHNQSRLGSYLNVGDKKKNRILKKAEHSGVKGLLKIDKFHFDPTHADFEYSVAYNKKKYNRCFKHHNQLSNSNDPK
ncbi:24_t:CDS:1, partial [Dentiscutata erythropus]